MREALKALGEDGGEEDKEDDVKMVGDEENEEDMQINSKSSSIQKDITVVKTGNPGVPIVTDQKSALVNKMMNV